MILKEFDAPCGRLLLGVHGPGLCLCDWITGNRIDKTLLRIGRFLPEGPSHDAKNILDAASAQLDEYFHHGRQTFDIPILTYGSEFQLRVWDALKLIPYGQTASYKEIASAIGLPEGVRAVASAIGANPLSVIIPCHRIIGSDGNLTGYAGGLNAKRYLLQLESQV